MPDFTPENSKSASIACLAGLPRYEIAEHKSAQLREQVEAALNYVHAAAIQKEIATQIGVDPFASNDSLRNLEQQADGFVTAMRDFVAMLDEVYVGLSEGGHIDQSLLSPEAIDLAKQKAAVLVEKKGPVEAFQYVTESARKMEPRLFDAFCETAQLLQEDLECFRTGNEHGRQRAEAHLAKFAEARTSFYEYGRLMTAAAQSLN